MRIVFMGPPGVGKGTQAVRAAQRLGIVHLSTGEMLRQAYEHRTETGLRSHEYLASGQLVPDPIILDIVRERLAQPDCKSGALFDGFPRTVGQAEAFDEQLRKSGTPLDAVIELTADEDEIVQRLASRGRADDQPDVVRNRLQLYALQTAPLADYYRKQNLLHSIDGAGTIDEVFERVSSVLDNIAQQRRDFRS